MEQPVLQVRDLRFSYDGKGQALGGVSLDIRAGERIAVLGPNGAGKSTFFLCLNGVLTPGSGEILLDGKPVGKKERKRLCERVGIVFQNADDQIIASTVAAEVSFGPMNLRLPKEEVVRRVDHALDYMDLQAFRARPPHELSGGEKKRVTIADILAMESEVILFDEPAASLDPMGEERLEAVLGRLSDEGRTLVISTHDMDFAFRWATRAVVFAGGQVIADGAPDAVFRDAETLRRAHLKPPALLEVFDMLRARGLVPADAVCPRTAAGLEALLDSGRA
ncbi:MAG TPA: energy-coupling factor ABC transporter ATP-binding protein [Candidatus Agathobaculum stercoravium]|nr:energy-coupling factor ABC transporter ATP-binding protein [Candidatus Agathobaculum stercoravium]